MLILHLNISHSFILIYQIPHFHPDIFRPSFLSQHNISPMIPQHTLCHSFVTAKKLTFAPTYLMCHPDFNILHTHQFISWLGFVSAYHTLHFHSNISDASSHLSIRLPLIAVYLTHHFGLHSPNPSLSPQHTSSFISYLRFAPNL